MSVIGIPGILSPLEIEMVLAFAENSVHHDDDEGHGYETIKPNFLPSVAHRVFARIHPHIPSGFVEIDPWMKFYRMTNASSIVPAHKDKDFKTQSGLIATWSVLIFLNEDYLGGETVFANQPTPVHGEGSALIFPHDLLHEGKRVTDGTKLVLKTDLCVNPLSPYAPP